MYLACSCICHTCFTLHRRHYDEDTLHELLRRVEETGSEPVEHAEYTAARLLCAADRNGVGLAAKRVLLAEHPRNKEQSLKLMVAAKRSLLAENPGNKEHERDHVSEVRPMAVIGIASSSSTTSSLKTVSRLESHDNVQDDGKMTAVDIDRIPTATLL